MARSSGGGIIWSGDLPKNLVRVDPAVRAAMALAVKANAPRIEEWMKTNAPWKDQTGNARNGLRAEARVGKDDSSIVMYGSVPYQIWLEVRFGGRYAIIGPAVAEWAPRVMESVATYVAATLRKVT